MRHEGLRLQPYLDTTGHMTIGYGRNLTDKGISEEEAYIFLWHDIAEAELALHDVFSDFGDFSSKRKMALTDMMYCLGKTGFLGFKHMIESIRIGDWVSAADAMRNSLWAEQAPNRVSELARMIEEG